MTIQSPSNSHLPRTVFTTGSLRLDFALSTRGIPDNAFVEIFGPENCGKTTLCLHIIAEAQKVGAQCLFIDCDEYLTKNFALSRGIDLHKLCFSRPDNPMLAGKLLLEALQTKLFQVIVFDSLTFLTYQVSIMSEQPSQAGVSLLSQFRRLLIKVEQLTKENPCLVIFTHTTLPRPSVVYHRLAKTMDKLTLSLLADIRIKLNIQHLIPDEINPLGWRTQAQVIKNAYLPCSTHTYFDIIYKEGIDKIGEVFSLGLEKRLITMQDGGFFYREQSLGTLKEKAIQTLRAKPSLQKNLKREIRRSLKI